jgi:hypothetical protein
MPTKISAERALAIYKMRRQKTDWLDIDVEMVTFDWLPSDHLDPLLKWIIDAEALPVPVFNMPDKVVFTRHLIFYNMDYYWRVMFEDVELSIEPVSNQVRKWIMDNK